MTTTTATAVQQGATNAPLIEEHSRYLPRLIGWLFRRAAMRQESKVELAQQLGVTHGYLYQLANGARSLECISSNFARACAQYLDIPAVVVMVAAGRIGIEDFLMPEGERSPTKQLAEGLERIAADPIVGALMPDAVWDVPDSVKALLVALYEDATQRELFPPRHLPAIFQGLRDAVLLVEEQDANDTAWRTAAYFASQGGGNE